MKNVKKALIGTALAGTLVIGAGAGTYSWFTASYNASGDITNHTLSINESLTAQETLDFDNVKLAPSRTVSDRLTIKNTGSMEQILRVKADLALYDGSTNVAVPDKSQYEMTATVFKDGVRLGGHTGSVEDIDDYLESKAWHPNNNGADVNFMPDDEFVIKLDVKLKETAGNEYQGKRLRGTVTVEAKQTDSGAQF